MLTATFLRLHTASLAPINGTLQVEEQRLVSLHPAADVRRAALPFYCRFDSWILGNWSMDGHTFFPHTLERTDGAMTSLSPADSYHIHTTAETRECLRNRHLYFLGPSYLRDVYTSIVDLLHDYDRVGYRQMNPPPINATLVGSGFEGVSLIKINGFWLDFNKIPAAMDRIANHTVVADMFIWDLNKAAIERTNSDMELAEEIYFMNLRRFLVLCRQHHVRLLWMTQMGLRSGTGVSTVPQVHRVYQTPDRIFTLLQRTIPMLDEFGVPWLDVYHMADICVTDPTETDLTQPCNPSGHSNWYVSAMKAQMLLNYVCRGCAEDALASD